MSRNGHRLRSLAFLFVLSLCPAAGAETVHTWIDAKGVRHFSQYPPVDPQQKADTLELEPLPGVPETADRLQTIRDVSRDLERARQEREEQRARKAPPEPPAPAVSEPPASAPTYVLPYPYIAPYPPAHPAPPRRPHPHGRPEPEEPEEPPPRPGGKLTTPGAQSTP